AVGGLDGDVAQAALPGHLDEVDRADVPAPAADHRGDTAEHARLVPDLQPDGEAVGRARGDGHQDSPRAGLGRCVNGISAVQKRERPPPGTVYTFTSLLGSWAGLVSPPPRCG